MIGPEGTDMTAKIQLTAEAERTLRMLQTLPQEMAAAIGRAMDAQNVLTVSHIQAKYESFPKHGPAVPMGLRVRTGRLRGAVSASKAIVLNNGRVESAIGDSVKYARIHEFGGRTRAHVIKPKKGQFLRYQIGERVIFAREVKHPGSNIPARAPIQSGINDRLNDYAEAISNAIVGAMKK
jgi:phage gpG-like protein